MKQSKEQQHQQMKDNINKVLSDMVSLGIHDFLTTQKGLIIGDGPYVTPEFVVDLFNQHVRRIFAPGYELPTLESIATFRLQKYDPEFELLSWDKPASSIYVKKNP